MSSDGMVKVRRDVTGCDGRHIVSMGSDGMVKLRRDVTGCEGM